MCLKKYVALVDGFCESNGSYYAKAGGSYAIFEVPKEEFHPPIEVLKDPIIFNSKFLFNKIEGERIQTNNVAEAEAMFLLLSELVNNNLLKPDNSVIIYSDSTLVINQVKQVFKINNTQLRKTYKRINEVFQQYKIKYEKSIWESLIIKHVSGNIMKRTVIGH